MRRPMPWCVEASVQGLAPREDLPLAGGEGRSRRSASFMGRHPARWVCHLPCHDRSGPKHAPQLRIPEPRHACGSTRWGGGGSAGGSARGGRRRRGRAGGSGRAAARAAVSGWVAEAQASAGRRSGRRTGGQLVVGAELAPWSTTAIRSARRTVERRWATTWSRPCMSRSIASTAASVPGSRLRWPSSRTRTAGRQGGSRQRHQLPLAGRQAQPRSRTSVSTPSGKAAKCSHADGPHRGVDVVVGRSRRARRMLSRMVPRTGSPPGDDDDALPQRAIAACRRSTPPKLDGAGRGVVETGHELAGSTCRRRSADERQPLAGATVSVTSCRVVDSAGVGRT
jgi:hypothetical protein